MEHAIVLGLILIALGLFISEVLRPDVVAMGLTLVLALTGIIGFNDAFSGFSNPAVITVIAMFILSAGLIRTGVADWIADAIMRVGGGNPITLTVVIMLAVGIMSAFMNNIGAVAVMMPAIFLISQRAGYPASRLLMPLSFGSLLGGLLTVIGTPPNLLVSIALEEHGFEGFKVFDFLPTGLAVLAVGIVYMIFVGRHLIPVREGSGDLTEQFKLQDYLTEAIITGDSHLDGVTVRQSKLRDKLGLGIVRIVRKAGARNRWLIPSPELTLRTGDRLVLQGQLGELLKHRKDSGLEFSAENKFTEEDLTGEEAQLAEVVVAPNSSLIGRTVRDYDARRSLNVLVLALKRRSRTIGHEFEGVRLEAGDVLLIQGSPAAIGELLASPDFLVVSKVEHAVQERRKAPLALGIMALSISLAATGVLHISIAAMLGAFLMAATACIKVDEMYHAVDWRVVFLIAFMMPLGIAMDSEHAGTAEWLAGNVVAFAGDHGPLVMMACLFLFTTLITEVMSNAAAAVLLAPISIAISNGMGIEPYPFLMAIAIGASTTFLSPIGHQSNILIYGVGNYRFTDFPRAGALLNVLIFFTVLYVVPLVWPFTPLP